MLHVKIEFFENRFLDPPLESTREEVQSLDLARSRNRHPLPQRSKLIGVITIVTRRLSRCHRLRYRYTISQPLPHPFKSANNSGRKEGADLFLILGETGVVGCRNTSTNYRETGIRGHPEGPRAPQTSSLHRSSAPGVN